MITLEEIREIHKITIEMDRNNPDDYAPGERYIGIVEHMLEHGMSEEYSVYLNAAVALHTIASRHPFNNGNKRTASAAAGIILMDDVFYPKIISSQNIYRCLLYTSPS